jgi:hypothetical protein
MRMPREEWGHRLHVGIETQDWRVIKNVEYLYVDEPYPESFVG